MNSQSEPDPRDQADQDEESWVSYRPYQGQVRLDRLLKKLPVAAYACDADGEFACFNDHAERLFGRVPRWNEHVSEFWSSFQLFDPGGDPIPQPDQLFCDVLRHRQSLQQEIVLLRSDGRRFHIMAHANPISCESGQLIGAVGVLIDITQRRQAEEERQQLADRFVQTQKLESLGVLAAGIAHDFNNLLTVVLGGVLEAQTKVSPDSPIRPILREIEQASKHASTLTQQLLAYAGKGSLTTEQARLDDIVQETLSIFQSLVAQSASIALHLEPAPFIGDAVQIRQVVMNLLTNAVDSLGIDGGNVDISTGIRRMEPADLRSQFLPEELPPGDYAFVRVRDTGCGMQPDTLPRIFDPFFTTKLKGRGLGLAAVLGIVRSHRGTIQVDSRPGEGTEIQILLPLAPQPGESADSSPVAVSPATGTVLLVLKDASLRQTAQAELSAAGFEVVLVDDDQEIPRRAVRHQASLAALVVDVDRPTRSGFEVLRHVRMICPNLPVVLLGDSNDSRGRARAERIPYCQFLSLPFKIPVLTAILRDLVKYAGPTHSSIGEPTYQDESRDDATKSETPMTDSSRNDGWKIFDLRRR